MVPLFHQVYCVSSYRCSYYALKFIVSVATKAAVVVFSLISWFSNVSLIQEYVLKLEVKCFRRSLFYWEMRHAQWTCFLGRLLLLIQYLRWQPKLEIPNGIMHVCHTNRKGSAWRDIHVTVCSSANLCLCLVKSLNNGVGMDLFLSALVRRVYYHLIVCCKLS